MLRTRGRKILRDLVSRKFRTIMVSASIFVGVLGVIALFTTSDLLIKRLEEDVQENELSMIDVTVSISNGAEPDNATYLATLNQENERGQSLSELEGIEIVEAGVIRPVGFKSPGGEVFEEGFIIAYSTPLQDRQIEPAQLLKGHWPVAGNNQITLEKRMADKYGFSVGDTIIFRSVNEAGITHVEYTVVGLVYQPYVENASNSTPDNSIYAQYEDAQAILNVTGYSNFWARYETYALAEEHFEDFQTAIADNTLYVPVFALTEDPAQNTMIESTQNTNNVLNMLAIVAMVVSGFLVVNVINSIIVEQQRQIGVIKSLGGTRWDNFIIYTGIALAYGIIGTVPAVLLGVPLGFQMTKSMGIAPLSATTIS